jgi:GNAT superfamily N-acetyltransferase
VENFRRATVADIARLAEIRGAVRENRLSDPGSVTQADYDRFVGGGRVWVCDVDGRIAGFSASDGHDGSIWALFVDPDCQGQGIGARLLHHACADLRAEGHGRAVLTTDPGTRADRLYRRLGWTDLGIGEDGEVRFARAL